MKEATVLLNSVISRRSEFIGVGVVLAVWIEVLSLVACRAALC